MRKQLAVFCLLLFSGVSAIAETAPHWLQVKTAHFTVITDGSDRQARHTAGQLERMHDVFAKLLPNAADDAGSRIVVLAFKDRRGFQAVEPAAYLAKNALELAGLFMREPDRSYILLRLDAGGDHPYATVYHEYTHYMVRHAEFLPVWLNEGLAQFYQNTDISDQDVRLGEPDANSILFLRQQRLLPLDVLFRVDHNSPYYHEENKGNIFYAESWALTHFLFLRDFGAKEGSLHQYAVYMARGEDPATAARLAFGDLNVLQRQLQDYIDHGEYRELHTPLQNAVDERSLKVEPIAQTEADAIRADVLAANGRTKEAEALIETVLAATPENAQAHESMGLIKLREGDMQAARKWYGEAVSLHSDSFLAYYYYGTLSMSQGAADAATGESLREAVKLNPKFDPALEAVAQFDMMQREQLDEALAMSLRAVEADPGKIQYRLNAAEVRMARKEWASAASVLQNALKFARTPEERAQVQSRLDQVQSYSQQLKRNENLRKQAADEVAHQDPRAIPPSGMVTDASGHPLRATKFASPDHEYPAGPPTGAKHTVTGTLHSVKCYYPKGLSLSVAGADKPVALYANDMYGIQFTAVNFTPKKDINPCDEFEGMKAKVTYASVEDPSVAGQIVSMDLSK